MSIFEIGMVALRDRKRLADIVAIVARFGVGDVLSRLGLSGLVPASHGLAGEADQASAPERLRRALEELGPTFVKLGQIISTRSDLLPPEWTEELARLQSDVSPMPWASVAAQIEDDVGGPVDQVFAAFEQTAFAAGSIAQVHRAMLQDGTEVVVKVRREGLRPLVDADLRLLSYLAQFAQAQWPELARYRPKEILNNLGAAMAEELDLAVEARHCESIAENLAGLDGIVIPRIHREWTSERLLVQDFVSGIAPNEIEALDQAGHDRAVLAERGATAFLHMALVDGYFHADPHPGNLRALPGDRIAFIDFGMVGRLGGRRREQLLTLLSAIVEGNGGPIAMLLLEWSGSAATDLSRLEAACDAFVARHQNPPLRLSRAVADFTTLVRDNELALPPDLALLFKALITADGVMHGLNADFDAIRVAAPIVRREIRRGLALPALAGKSRSLAGELARLMADVPAVMRLLLMHVRRGRLAAEIEINGLDRLGADIRWAAIRIAVAIVTAAFALGLAPHLFNQGPRVLGAPLPLWLGLGVIAGGLLWLIIPRRG